MPHGQAAGARHAVLEYSKAVVMDDHGMPVHKSSVDHNSHALCNQGGGCFAFTLAEVSQATRVPTVHLVTLALIPLLSARSIAPPLPPPISLIIA